MTDSENTRTLPDGTLLALVDGLDEIKSGLLALVRYAAAMGGKAPEVVLDMWWIGTQVLEKAEILMAVASNSLEAWRTDGGAV